MTLYLRISFTFRIRVSPTPSLSLPSFSYSFDALFPSFPPSSLGYNSLDWGWLGILFKNMSKKKEGEGGREDYKNSVIVMDKSLS